MLKIFFRGYQTWKTGFNRVVLKTCENEYHKVVVFDKTIKLDNSLILSWTDEKFEIKFPNEINIDVNLNRRHIKIYKNENELNINYDINGNQLHIDNKNVR